ncbi:hypothetical protein Tco_1448272 [Tanacetum coccineum]
MRMGLRNENGMVNTIFEILRPVAIPRTEPVGDKDGDVKRFPDKDGDGVEKRGWDSKYDLRNSPPVAIPRSDRSDDGRLDRWVEVLSWEPRAVIYHNFLCDLQEQRQVCTSSGTFLDRGQDETVRAIEKRISDFTFLHVEHGEGLQILHYEVGQKYKPHYDYFLDNYNTKSGG